MHRSRRRYQGRREEAFVSIAIESLLAEIRSKLESHRARLAHLFGSREFADHALQQLTDSALSNSVDPILMIGEYIEYVAGHLTLGNYLSTDDWIRRRLQRRGTRYMRYDPLRRGVVFRFDSNDTEARAVAEYYGAVQEADGAWISSIATIDVLKQLSGRHGFEIREGSHGSDS